MLINKIICTNQAATTKVSPSMLGIASVSWCVQAVRIADMRRVSLQMDNSEPACKRSKPSVVPVRVLVMEHVRYSEDEMETLTPHVLRFVLHASKNQGVHNELDVVDQTSMLDLDEIADTFHVRGATPEQAERAWNHSCPRLDAALRDTKGGELQPQRVTTDEFARAVMDCPVDRFVHATVDSETFMELDDFESAGGAGDKVNGP